MDALGERLNADRLHRGQSVSEHSGEDFDHLPIAVVRSGDLAPDPFEPRRQHPILERRPDYSAPIVRNVEKEPSPIIG
jgi:hypothetical protein